MLPYRDAEASNRKIDNFLPVLLVFGIVFQKSDTLAGRAISDRTGPQC
jgi:hypothetical protein